MLSDAVALHRDGQGALSSVIAYIVRRLLHAPGFRFVDLGPTSLCPTPLSVACYYDLHPGVTRALIEAGGTLWWADGAGKTECPLSMAVNQGSWRHLYLGLRMWDQTKSTRDSWAEMLEALAREVCETSCLFCLLDTSADRERCHRCLHDEPHSPHADFEKCVDVLIRCGLRSFIPCAPNATNASTSTRHILQVVDERFRCRLAEVRACDLGFLGNVLDTGGDGHGYVDESLARGDLSAGVHAVLKARLVAGAATSADVMECRPKVLALHDREMGETPRCIACEPLLRPSGQRQCRGREAHTTVQGDADADTHAKRKVFKCTRCLSAWYCSVECQKAHWPIHKRVCNKPWADMRSVFWEAQAAERTDASTCGHTT